MTTSPLSCHVAAPSRLVRDGFRTDARRTDPALPPAGLAATAAAAVTLTAVALGWALLLLP